MFDVGGASECDHRPTAEGECRVWRVLSALQRPRTAERKTPHDFRREASSVAGLWPRRPAIPQDLPMPAAVKPPACE